MSEEKQKKSMSAGTMIFFSFMLAATMLLGYDKFFVKPQIENLNNEILNVNSDLAYVDMMTLLKGIIADYQKDGKTISDKEADAIYEKVVNLIQENVGNKAVLAKKSVLYGGKDITQSIMDKIKEEKEIN